MATINMNGMTIKKEINFGEWYVELLKKCKLISYTDISGCYVLLPNSYSIWENIVKALDLELKKVDVQNSYFPLFITQQNLKKEQDHVEGFAPEVAIVTKTGNTDLDPDNYLIIRPTSETTIYATYKTLIHSYRDLPLKYNQYCNVVRWEFKDTMPFIRSREFLWSETHNCFANKIEATNDVDLMINLYSKIYSETLAIPTIMGTKTNLEKFNGSVLSKTLECIIPNVVKGVQACTSHYLGNIFSKAFDISFRSASNDVEFVHQTCHGFTTRSIGIMLLTHSDNKGLVLPPYVAKTQVVIIPILQKESQQLVMNYIYNINELLIAANIRTSIDVNEFETMGFKCNKHELGGIPVRLEIGMRDVENNEIVLFRRDTCTKQKIKTVNVVDSVLKTFTDINNNLFDKASNLLKSNINGATNINEFRKNIKSKKINLINWCNTDNCEKKIKHKFGVKTFCIIDENNELNKQILEKNIDVLNCIFCNEPCVVKCLFGKSY